MENSPGFSLKLEVNMCICVKLMGNLFAVIQTGTIAAVGVAFAKFVAYLFPVFSEDNILLELMGLKISSAQILGILSIVVLTWLNSRGVKNGKWVQTFLTIIKILSLVGLILAGLFFAFDAEVWNANWTNAWDTGKWNSDGQTFVSVAGMAVFAGVVSAMVGSLFSSDAWNNVTFIAGEMKNPNRNIGLSLLFGTLIVTVAYVLMNLMYVATLPMNEIAFAQNDRVGVASAMKIFGSGGAMIIAVMIIISTFGCNNGLIMSGARVYYTMAKDGLFFKKAGDLNRFEVPAWGLWIQCIWASALCLSGKYGDLLDYVVIAVLIFYILTILGIFILRKKRPDLSRTYKAFGYPILPALYILTATTICVGLLVYKTEYTVPGVLIILVGIPIYYWVNRKK